MSSGADQQRRGKLTPEVRDNGKRPVILRFVRADPAARWLYQYTFFVLYTSVCCVYGVTGLCGDVVGIIQGTRHGQEGCRYWRDAYLSLKKNPALTCAVGAKLHRFYHAASHPGKFVMAAGAWIHAVAFVLPAVLYHAVPNAAVAGTAASVVVYLFLRFRYRFCSGALVALAVALVFLVLGMQSRIFFVVNPCWLPLAYIFVQDTRRIFLV